MDGAIDIGTAGWSIPRQVADRFPAAGSALERYAARFPVVEINSSFHRPHRPSTWQRWRDSVPQHFRFSVKLPKTITHVRKLADSMEELTAFLDQVRPLGEKLAVLLAQLPPKLEFDTAIAAQFFSDLRGRTSAALACEPRNVTWFTPAAEALLQEWRVARVAADPALCPAAAVPSGWSGLRYWRLHGSPTMYRSSYSDRIDQLAAVIRSGSVGCASNWCIFDNTASSAAISDALALGAAIRRNVDSLMRDTQP
jgi:uncharacterized protein YecE (DUF72 family)